MNMSMKYLRATMTGAEGYKAMKFFLLKCYEVMGEEHVQWLALALESDPALINDWQEAIRYMIIEREKYGNEELVNVNDKLPVFKECDCWLQGRKYVDKTEYRPNG